MTTAGYVIVAAVALVAVAGWAWWSVLDWVAPRDPRGRHFDPGPLAAYARAVQAERDSRLGRRRLERARARGER